MPKLNGSPGPRQTRRGRPRVTGTRQSDPSPRPSRLGHFLRILEAPSTVAAFLLSLGVFFLGGLQAVRGPEIVVLQPREMVLYRDAQSETADALVIATELAMINTASDAYGDVATSVELTMADFEGAAFAYEASITPTFLRRGEDDRLADCPVSSRCILPVGPGSPQDGEQPNTRLLVIANQRDLLDVPGGSARANWISFALSDCTGGTASCEGFSGFSEAVASLRQATSLRTTIDLSFHSDGQKTVICQMRFQDATHREAFFDFLEERGWVSFRCQ